MLNNINKTFEFNEFGVCTNPNTIFRTTSKDSRYPYGGSYFSIATAFANGQWAYGIQLSMQGYGFGKPADNTSKDTFPTEKEAINAACKEINDYIWLDAKWRNSKNPTLKADELKVIAMLKEITNPKPIELSLFN